MKLIKAFNTIEEAIFFAKNYKLKNEGQKPIELDDNIILKDQEKIYIADPSEAPEGAKILQGKRGGKYYFGSGKESGIEEGNTKEQLPFKVRAVDRLKSTINKFTENIGEVLSQLPEDHVRGAEFYLVNAEDLKDKNDPNFTTYGTFEPMTGVISISSGVMNFSIEKVEAAYNKTMPGASHPWKLVVLHELGHRVMQDQKIKSRYKELLIEEGSRIYHTNEVDTVTPKVGVTQYALSNALERFAEAYLYYVQNPKELFKQDKKMFYFMRGIVFHNKEYPEPLIKELNDEELPEGSRWMEDGKYAKKVFEDNIEKSEILQSISDLLNNQESILKYNLKYLTRYIPNRTMVHGKNGIIRSAIRWKKFNSTGLTKIKSPNNLKGVKRLSETPTFTRLSEVRQTMFYLATEKDINVVKENNFIPTSNHNILKDGIYLYGNLDTATEKAKEEQKEVLPVKINTSKLFQTTLEKVKNQHVEELKDQGYTAIVLMTGKPYEFDLFVFNPEDIVIIGEDNITDSISKEVTDHEECDCIDSNEGGIEPFLNNDEKIEKAVIATPQNPDGTVNYKNNLIIKQLEDGNWGIFENY